MKMPGENARVLIVEDDPDGAKIISFFFQIKDQYEVVIATSPEDARTKEGSFDLMVTDGLEGRCFELCKQMIHIPNKLIYTGSDTVYREAKMKGILAYMKPSGIAEIMDMVRTIKEAKFKIVN